MSEHTDYLLAQYESMQRNCSVTLPVSTYTSTLKVSPSTVTQSQFSTTSTTIPATATSCLGQLIEPEDAVTCLGLSDAYNVSTGAAIRATQDDFCQFDTPICLPPPCEIDIVIGNPSCEELAAQYSTEGSPVTLTQFLTWNPAILGSCGHLNHVQRICKGPPGGRFKPSGVISAPTTAAVASEPTQTGTTANCGRYYKVVSGDTCNSVALRFGITFADLQSLNAYLWNNCTNLWLNYDVCVAPVSEAPISKDGTCGAANGYGVCEGSQFGKCCSTSGYCGSTGDYCGAGNCASGACELNTGATTNGTCGPDWGYLTCTNPSFGPYVLSAFFRLRPSSCQMITDIPGVVLYMDTVGKDRTSVGLGSVTREVVRIITVDPASTVSVDRVSLATRRALGRNLEIVALPRGTVGAPKSIVVKENAIPVLAHLDLVSELRRLMVILNTIQQEAEYLQCLWSYGP
ncbi:hypothetical protein Asppvi_001740 [Aspergillus pseudoviridinutans]|uniref:Carbohydrate-binding module family 18 protein n=1 Tax=Aspergillus pseudoviridinutans TaxID=1517512 RepID=A0A9P3B5R6_9EURO|nr:uncharacterized protein Asppvi_001740 [Aspergillus pseudoviridinutans]GIJ83220.1 hypothetical protein Asppvi_001740 [Aspergillus pseudoviridinutans]